MILESDQMYYSYFPNFISDRGYLSFSNQLTHPLPWQQVSSPRSVQIHPSVMLQAQITH